jgi:Tol biopolymer transport system component
MCTKAAGFLSIVCGLLCAAQTITPLSDRVDGLSSPALSPDATMLAYDAVSPDYSIWIDVRPFVGGKAVHFAGWQNSGGPNSPRWSPDGKRIAFLRFYCHSCNHKLFVKDFPNGPEKLLGEVCGGTPSWTPDGRFLIATELAGKYAGWDPCRLVLIPLGGGARVRLAKDGDELALTADGKRLAYAAGNAVRAVHLDANYRFADAPLDIAKEPHAISSIHWSADGRSLVYQVRNYTKAVTDGVVRLIHPAASIGISQILPDGGALGTEGRGPTALWRVDLKAPRLEPEKVRSIPWTDENLSVSPDGQWLAFATARNGPMQIWVSRLDGSSARVLIPAIPPFGRYGDKTAVDGVSWSPDGKLIAIQTQPGIGHGVTDARIFIIPSAGGRLQKFVDCGSTWRAPSWTEDGKALYTVKYSEEYEDTYFLADIATGSLTPIAEEKVPKLPLVPLPEGSGPPQVSQGGRFLYYEAPADWKPRLVKVEGLIPR